MLAVQRSPLRSAPRWPPAASCAGAPSLQDRSPWVLCDGHHLAGARL